MKFDTEEQEEKNLNVFELYKHIIKETEPLSDEVIDNSYNSIDMNRIISFDPSNVFFACKMNEHPFIPKRANYLCYFFGVDKKKYAHFLQIKKDKNEQDEELIKKSLRYLPEYNRKMVSEILPLIKDEMSKIKTIDGGVDEN